MKEIIELFKWKEKRKRFGHRQLTCTVMFPYIFRKLNVVKMNVVGAWGENLKLLSKPNHSMILYASFRLLNAAPLNKI